MANAIYEQLNGNQTQNNAPDFQSQFQLFRQNPIQFMAQRNLNIPAEYQNDPHAAVNYLVQNGQMNQQGLQRVVSTLKQMGFRF